MRHLSYVPEMDHAFWSTLLLNIVYFAASAARMKAKLIFLADSKMLLSRGFVGRTFSTLLGKFLILAHNLSLLVLSSESELVSVYVHVERKKNLTIKLNI